MSTQVLHMTKFKAGGGHLGAHILGDRRPSTALPRTTEGEDGKEVKLAPVVNLDDDGKKISDRAARDREKEGLGYVRSAQADVGAHTAGRKAAPLVGFVVAGPPAYAAAAAWHQRQVEMWAAESVRWIRKRAGAGAKIVYAALHQDEAAPHLHVWIAAADEKRRLGWNRIRAGFGGGTGKAMMRSMQDGYHADVASKYGLDRGQKGSTATHQKPDRVEGLRQRLAEEVARGDRLGQRGDRLRQEVVELRVQLDLTRSGPSR